MPAAVGCWKRGAEGETLLRKAHALLLRFGPTKTLARCLSNLASAQLLAGAVHQLHAQAAAMSRPEPFLHKISARLLAINFADDLANALELGSVEEAVAKIPNARSIVVSASDKSRSHFGSRYPELWKRHLEGLLESLPSVGTDEP